MVVQIYFLCEVQKMDEVTHTILEQPGNMGFGGLGSGFIGGIVGGLLFGNGGWGGCVAGISSIDDMDASENSSSSFYNFKTGQWYRFRVQVTLRTVRVWVNDEKIIDYVVEGHSLKTRFEVSRCQPLGFASWVSDGRIKVVRMRALSDEEIKEMDERAEEASKFITPDNY